MVLKTWKVRIYELEEREGDLCYAPCLCTGGPRVHGSEKKHSKICSYFKMAIVLPVF